MWIPKEQRARFEVVAEFFVVEEEERKRVVRHFYKVTGYSATNAARFIIKKYKHLGEGFKIISVFQTEVPIGTEKTALDSQESAS